MRNLQETPLSAKNGMYNGMSRVRFQAAWLLFCKRAPARGRHAFSHFAIETRPWPALWFS
jgi:hypothetical protein